MPPDTHAVPHPQRPIASANPFRCFQGVFLRDAFLMGLAIVVRTVLSIRRLDELLLKVHLEGIAISFTIFASLISGWAMLEKAGAPSIEWGVWAWPVMALLWCVAVVIRGRQYR